MFRIHYKQRKILKYLNNKSFNDKINFDLQDNDRILRVAGIEEVNIQDIILNVNKLGFQCEILV